MKNLWKKVASKYKKLLLVFGLVAAAVVIPFHAVAADQVLIESSLGVANVTKGDTLYKHSVDASYDQVVKFQVFYHNREQPDSGKVAKNVRVKVDLPENVGATQVVKSTVKGDNTNTVESTATVNLDRSDAKLDFMPGSVVWKHNIGTNSNVNYVEQKLSDNTILQGLPIENEKPCHNFEATVTFLMRVHVPSVSIVKQVREKGTTTRVTNLTVKPGATVEYLISFKNLGNTDLTHLTVNDKLPEHITFVPGTVKLYNGPNPGGAVINNDFLFRGGVDGGTFKPGSNGFVGFDAKVDEEKDLECGTNVLKNIAVVDTDQTGNYHNSATVNVEKKCANVPSFSCDLLSADKISNRTFKFTVNTSAANGATISRYFYNFGDGTDELTTDQASVTHTYSHNGTFAVSAKVEFKVNGETKVVDGEACKTVIKTNKPPVTPPKELPNTGAGDVAGIFSAVTIAGATFHRFFLRRNLV